MPILSIVTSTYNRSKDFLPKCIDSVKRQGYRSYEHIIVDDCSTDGTEEYIRKLRCPKTIKYHKLDKNSGSDTKPKNIGISMAKGKYIMFLDDDVTLRKGAIKSLITEINKGYDVVYGDMVIQPGGKAGIAYDFDLQLLSMRNYIDTSAAISKKSVIKYVGGFDETLPRFVDWNLFVRMAKAGFQFKRLKRKTFNYYAHENTKSNRISVQTYNHPELGRLFVPTFDPVGCKIKLDRKKKPRVAIFTIHYDRLEYSKQSYKEMVKTAGYDFDWFCADNGSDGTYEWLREDRKCKFIKKYPENVGLTKSSNDLINVIKEMNNYDIIIKIDNDVEFITYGWLRDIVKLWEKNHLIYISPYVEGLKDNPGGALRIGSAMVGEDLLEVTKHIGGIFATIDAKAYDDFRWKDNKYHGFQDLEASTRFAEDGYMPCYFPKHIIRHRDSTEKQHIKYKNYFERRKDEKITRVKPL